MFISPLLLFMIVNVLFVCVIFQIMSNIHYAVFTNSTIELSELRNYNFVLYFVFNPFNT